MIEPAEGKEPRARHEEITMLHIDATATQDEIIAAAVTDCADTAHGEMIAAQGCCDTCGVFAG